MRRALQQLRVVVATQLFEAMIAGKAVLVAILFLLLPIPFLLLGLALPAAAILIFVLLRGGPPPRTVVEVALLFGMVGASVGLLAGLAVPYVLVKRKAERVRRQARGLVHDLEATTPVVCPNCGAHVAVVTLGPEEPCPCPWCDSPLLSEAGGVEDTLRAAAEALCRRDPELGGKIARNLGRTVESAVAPRVPGFELVGAGSLARGTTAGVSLRAFSEIVGGNFVHRIEGVCETALPDEVFLVRPAIEVAMRALAREWGYALPEHRAMSPRLAWHAYVAEGSALPEAPAIAAALDRLGPNDALLLDPAGISLWRKAFGLTRAWSLLEQHHATVAALACGLRNGR